MRGWVAFGGRFGGRCGGPCAGLLAALLAACAQAPPADDDFERWQAARTDALAALQARLAQDGVAEVLPLPQLLRSASSWQACGAERWALPPAEQWPAVVSVLRLLQALRAAGAVGAIEVHSGYRDEALNSCAGGAARSAHRLQFALDVTPADGRDIGPSLCRFWREHGRDWRMGLGRYASGRMHIDTAGHRAWGGDPEAGPCPAPPPADGR